MNDFIKLKKYFGIVLGVLIITSCDSDSSQPNQEKEFELNYSLMDCVSVNENSSTLEVVTWNIENYPTYSQHTPQYVLGTIVGSEFDLWGIQEIENPYYINLVEEYSNYKTVIDTDLVSGINDKYHLGYVYNSDRLELKEATVLNQSQFESYYFPRRPLLAVFKNLQNNEEFVVINLHLKCCGGEANNERRIEASNILKEFIDQEYSNASVIVLGDFNSSIVPAAESNFYNFIEDDQNYFFADTSIALENNGDWSYPSYPSHIDHILISNELFEDFESSHTLELESCEERYDRFISDHRPVLTLFKN